MSEQVSISVNFGRPMPVFPLESVTLLPQQVVPLHIFEPRYRQMIDHILDGAGQLAMGVFEGDDWKSNYHGVPQIKPYVCIGQIAQHEKLSDGRYNILLQGVCRAKVIEEAPPDEQRQYRVAMLRPVGMAGDREQLLDDHRERIRDMLTEGPLEKLTAAETVSDYLKDDEVPTSAIFELIGFTMLTDPETRYRLLSEEDVVARAGIVEGELQRIESLLRRASSQRPEEWPKGLSWN
jgi:Lon protease-like protein